MVYFVEILLPFILMTPENLVSNNHRERLNVSSHKLFEILTMGEPTPEVMSTILEPLIQDGKKVSKLACTGRHLAITLNREYIPQQNPKTTHWDPIQYL